MFIYRGDPNDPGGMPESIDLFGYHFTKGAPVKVEDKLAIAKLKANSHFEEVDGRRKTEPEKPASLEEPENGEQD